MSTSSAKLTGSSMAIAKYLNEEKLSGVLGAAEYYADEGAGPRSRGGAFGPDDVVFRAEQILGSGAEAMGWDLSRGLTMSMFQNVCEGKHPTTGEQLTKAGYRITYELDDDGKPKVDADGNRIRRLDADGNPVKAEAVHTLGIDVFLAAPKCVSILNTVAARENPALQAAILGAHDQAVAEALAWVETTAPLGRRTLAKTAESADQVTNVVPRQAETCKTGPRKGQPCKTQGSKSERVPVQLVIVSARQHTARPTEATMGRGAPPDMHLHSHNLILGVAWDPVTDKYVVVDDYSLKTTAVERDARYMAALARNLEDLGIEIDYGTFEQFEVSKHGRVPWQIKGITPEAVDHFSSNHKRAWDLVKDYEARTNRAATGAVLQERMKGTRRSKDPLAKRMDSNPIYKLWHDDAERCGITMATPALRQALARGPRPLERPPHEQRLAELWRRCESSKGFTMAEATFTWQSATSTVARCAEGLGFSADDLATIIDRHLPDRLIAVPGSPERRPRWTTPKNLADEHFIDRQLHLKAQARFGQPSRQALLRAVAAQAVNLDAEQRQAVEQMCSGTGLSIWEGYAGTGKTTALKAGVAALRAEGLVDRVVVASTAALTAKSTGHKLGADFAGSVEAVSTAVAYGRLKIDAKTLVIFDESAMCDTRRAATFLKLTAPARTVLVGDPEQAQAIGAAGWYADASTWWPKAVLTNVHRQNDHRDVVDLAKLRGGEAIDVVTSLKQRERFHVSLDHQYRLAKALADYEVHRNRGRSATDVRIIIDASNAAVDQANRQVQRYRRDHGEIGAQGFEVESTNEGRRWTLHAGDEVLFLRPYGEGARRIANGTTGTIKALDPARSTALVKLDDGGVAQVRLSATEERQPLGLAYSVHTNKFQGAEVPVVLALPGPAGVTNKNTAYSTLSRCIEEAHVYADLETHGESPESTLAAAWSRSPVQVSARRAMGEVPMNAPRQAHPGQAPEHRHLSVEDENLRAAHLWHIARTGGEPLAQAVEAAPAFPELQARLKALHYDGADTAAMLRTVIRAREINSANDPAAVLIYRLEHTARIQRADELRAFGRRAPQRGSEAPATTEHFTQLDEIRATARHRPNTPTGDSSTEHVLDQVTHWQQQREAARQNHEPRQGPSHGIGL